MVKFVGGLGGKPIGALVELTRGRFVVLFGGIIGGLVEVLLGGNVGGLAEVLLGSRVEEEGRRGGLVVDLGGLVGL